MRKRKELNSCSSLFKLELIARFFALDFNFVLSTREKDKVCLLLNLIYNVYECNRMLYSKKILFYDLESMSKQGNIHAK